MQEIDSLINRSIELINQSTNQGQEIIQVLEQNIATQESLIKHYYFTIGLVIIYLVFSFILYFLYKRNIKRMSSDYKKYSDDIRKIYEANLNSMRKIYEYNIIDLHEETSKQPDKEVTEG